FARFRALIFTGGAQTRFVVNTPAAAAGKSDTIRARSSLRPFSEPLPVPSFLMSQKTAAHRKPRGAQMDAGICFHESERFMGGEFMEFTRSLGGATGQCSQQCGRFRISAHQVETLDCLATGPFCQVIDCTDYDYALCPWIHSRGN